MSRPFRVEVEGGWHHVISRGIERREIFGDDSDRRDFLERLFLLTQSHGILVHSYCLMDNHFHLQVQTPNANLKEAMQRLLSGYVVRFNLRHRRVGSLFQGRYRAILAGENEWITQVSRYIHLNPVRIASLGLDKSRQGEVRRGNANFAGEALGKERLEVLRSYPWSSYRAYAGYANGPEHLQTSEVLDCFEGTSVGEKRAAYRSFTEEAIREGLEGDDLMEQIRYGALLGSADWIAKMAALVKGNEREQPGLKSAKKGTVGFDEITGSIGRHYGEPWKTLSQRRGHPARALAILLCRKHTSLRLREIGELCGGMDYAAVSDACKRIRRKLKDDNALKTAIEAIENHFNPYLES